MTCDFKSFSTTSLISGLWLGDNEAACNGTPFTIERKFASGGARTRYRWVSRPALNPLSYRGSFHWAGEDSVPFVLMDGLSFAHTERRKTNQTD